MNIDLFKTGRVKDFSVGDAIESHTTREADGLKACGFAELAQHSQINLFKTGLQRGSQIMVARCERLGRIAHGSEVASQFRRKQFAESGSFVGFRPTHFGSSAMGG